MHIVLILISVTLLLAIVALIKERRLRMSLQLSSREGIATEISRFDALVEKG